MKRQHFLAILAGTIAAAVSGCFKGDRFPKSMSRGNEHWKRDGVIHEVDGEGFAFYDSAETFGILFDDGKFLRCRDCNWKEEGPQYDEI